MPVTRRYPPVTGIMPSLYFNQRKSIMSMKMFTTEEMLLAMEFKRLNRFRIRKVRDLKAGMYISVRSVPSQPNLLAYCQNIQRVPHMRHGNYPALVLGKSRYVFHIERGEKRVFTEHENATTLKYMNECEHCVSDWMIHNVCYRYNTKVMDAINRLMKARSFVQWCIIKGKPMNRRSQLEFVAQQDWDGLFQEFNNA